MKALVPCLFGLSLLLASRAVADGSLRAALQPVSIDASKAKVVEKATGFELLVDKTIEERMSKALKVRYAWGNNPMRDAWVYDAGTRWRVLFQDKPAPDEIADVTLLYSLEVSAEELAQVKAEVRGAVEGFFLALGGAAGGAAGLDAFLDDIKHPAIDEARIELKKFATKDGLTADELLLERMALSEADGKLMVKPSSAAAVLALAARARDLRASAHAEEVAWEAIKLTPRCGDTPLIRDNGLDDAQLKSCVTAYGAFVREALAALELPGGANEGDALEKSLAELEGLTLVKAEAVAAGPGGNTNGLKETIKKVYAAYVAAHGASKAVSKPPPDLLAKDPRLLALVWLATAGLRQHEEAQLVAPVVDQVAFALVSLRQQQRGSVLIERSAEKVWWDVSTGVVYLAELDEVAAPLLLAFCPANGCLRKGETSFDSGAGLGHSLSVDFGVRTSTVDATQDARSKDKPMLFYGASWNPIYFVRGSVGAYSFENAQTDKWNTGWYAGITFNIIHTAQLLGVVGFGSSELTVKDAEKK